MLIASSPDGSEMAKDLGAPFDSTYAKLSHYKRITQEGKMSSPIACALYTDTQEHMTALTKANVLACEETRVAERNKNIMSAVMKDLYAAQAAINSHFKHVTEEEYTDDVENLFTGSIDDYLPSANLLGNRLMETVTIFNKASERSGKINTLITLTFTPMADEIYDAVNKICNAANEIID